jgi:outer membrane protein TolC
MSPAIAAVAALALASSACAPSAAALRRPVDAELARRLGDPALAGAVASADPRALAAVEALLQEPLDRDAAVRIALATNARLQVALAELGIAGAGLALALGPLEVHAAVRAAGGSADLELDALQDLLGLISWAPRRAAARADAAAAQAQAVAAALQLVARVEIAFHDLVAAQQELELRRVAFDAAEAAALLRERMAAAGNAPALALARERAAREQARVDHARAEVAVEARREALNAALGLTGARTRWVVTAELPALPPAPPALDDLEPRAVAASTALAAERARASAAASRAREARLRSVVPRLAAGVSIHRDHHDDGSASGATVGPAIAIGIPLLDHGGAGRARAAAEQRRAEHALTAAAVELRAAARAARAEAIGAYREARHLRDVVLPLRQLIVDETLKHYNAMSADPFALIAARRDQVDGERQHLDALRRYWNAMSRATALLRGASAEPGPISAGEPAGAAAAPTHPGGH